MTPQLSKRDIAWLEAASYETLMGLYPGERWDRAPGRFASLHKRGLVSIYIPSNPSHKERAVITSEGRRLLAAARGA